MDFLKNELCTGECAPILLGDSGFARSVSRRFFSRYHVISHIFCNRVPFLRHFCLTAKYHTVTGFEKDELLLIALQDFAAGVQKRDLILYLISGNDHARQFIEQNREQLEADFVIADTQSLEKLIGTEPTV